MVSVRGKSLTLVVQSLLLIGLALTSAYLLYMDQRVPWVILAVVPVILAGWHYYEHMSKGMRRTYVVFLSILFIILILRTVGLMAGILDSHFDGDFKHFWISAHTAITGSNFYDPANLHAVIAQLDPAETPDWFITRLVDTGFWYPPMSIFVFLPLGLFDLQTAWTINYGFQWIVFLTATWALQETFFPDTGLLGYIMVATLLLVFYPTMIILVYSQTNFTLLLLVLLFWHYRDRPIAGVWLALAITVKPFITPLILFPILRKNWRVMLSLCLTMGALAAGVALLYGVDVLFGYKPDLPPFVYYEADNQGLLASLLRLADLQVMGPSPILHLPFLISALVLGLTSIWMVYFLPRMKDHWAVSILVMLGLLIYPSTRRPYSLFLILPLLWIWSEKEHFPGGTWGALLFISLEGTLIAYKLGTYTFHGVLIAWITVVLLGLKHLYAPDIGSTLLSSLSQKLRGGSIGNNLL